MSTQTQQIELRVSLTNVTQFNNKQTILIYMYSTIYSSINTYIHDLNDTLFCLLQGGKIIILIIIKREDLLTPWTP